MLNQPWTPDITYQKQPHYQPIKGCTYWPVLGAFNNWNIIQLSHKTTSGEEIDKINQVLLDGISDNIDGLSKTRKYGVH